MYVQLLGQLRQRLLTPHRGQGSLRLELRCVVPPWALLICLLATAILG